MARHGNSRSPFLNLQDHRTDYTGEHGFQGSVRYQAIRESVMDLGLLEGPAGWVASGISQSSLTWAFSIFRNEAKATKWGT